MERVWLGQGYRKQFEALDITQEGLNELETMFSRLYAKDSETRKIYSVIYKDKYKKGKNAVDWNIGILREYFLKDYTNNPDSFLNYVSKLTKPQKRSLFYLVKEIFKRK